ncbi:MAG TPA: hypothetical protein VIX81_12840 [Gammaproteobacteria bacterium]
MQTRMESRFASRLGTIIFFFACLLALPPIFAGLALLFDDNWSDWLLLTAVSVALVFASSTLNFLLSGCFLPGCRSVEKGGRFVA